jgi:hypothetical protein
MIVTARLFCSDERCDAVYEAVGTLEELGALACSCGAGLELIGFPDDAGLPDRRGFALLPLAA